MQSSKFNTVNKAVSYLSIGLLASATFAFGQDPMNAPQQPAAQQRAAATASGGWKRVGDPSANQAPATDPAYNSNSAYDPNQAPPPPPDNNNAPYPQQPASNQPSYPQQPNNYPQQQQPSYGQYPQPPYAQQQGPAGQPNYGPQLSGPMPYGGQAGYGQQPGYGAPQNYPAPPPVPASLTIPAGAFLTVRVNQLLSSDRNQAGDAFSATLQQPVVVNGVVVAEPGQTLGGRVAQAVKAGHVEGVARLGIQLITLSTVDGQQIPVQTQLVSRTGPTSVGQDAGTIAGTTALGAAIGAAADWGRGAAIGAGAGAAAGIIGVLVTRGHPSVIYPEQILTFRLEAPITVDTTRSAQAFRYIQPGEYDRPYNAGPTLYNNAGGPSPAYYGAYASAYPYPYYAWGYPYYWGPSFGFYYRGFYRPYYGGFRGAVVVRGGRR